jgi:F-type H+-transporting ATPase subunit b
MVQSVIFPYLNFALFIVILYYLVRKPSKDFAQKQRDDFIKMRQQALAAEQSAQKKLLLLEKRQKQLQQEILRMTQALEKESAKELLSLEEKSKNLVSYIEQESERRCSLQVERSFKELQKKIWNKSVDYTKEKIKSLDDQQHSRLLVEKIKELEKFVGEKEKTPQDLLQKGVV